MQKKLIALAVASLASGAAFAQTNVTIYGIADAGYVYSSGDPIKGVAGTNTFSGIVSGILSGSDVQLLRDNGVNAFLVGEACMRAVDPGTALAEVFS